MKHIVGVLTGALLVASALPAFAKPTFRAEVEGKKVVIYSTAEQDTACYTFVTFSYQRGDKRETTRFVCNTFARAQKDFRFCERGDYDDAKIEGPVDASC